MIADMIDAAALGLLIVLILAAGLLYLQRKGT
jgi:hypothetical protein